MENEKEEIRTRSKFQPDDRVRLTARFKYLAREGEEGIISDRYNSIDGTGEMVYEVQFDEGNLIVIREADLELTNEKEVILRIPTDEQTQVFVGETGFQARFEMMRMTAENANPGWIYEGRLGWENAKVVEGGKYKITLKREKR